MLADGVMEIRLIGEDGQLDFVGELSRPAYHALLIAKLLDWQSECHPIGAANNPTETLLPGSTPSPHTGLVPEVAAPIGSHTPGNCGSPM